jgi:hypothetical protein
VCRSFPHIKLRLALETAAGHLISGTGRDSAPARTRARVRSIEGAVTLYGSAVGTAVGIFAPGSVCAMEPDGAVIAVGVGVDDSFGGLGVQAQGNPSRQLFFFEDFLGVVFLPGLE